MRCYNCGCELTEHKFCTNCGVDVVLYKKIIRTSNYFYNQGLERAKVRDLSGAVVSLHQSLKFNKNNIKARNLLGLVYFEMGEVTAALSEWVISKNFRAKKNMAVDYLEMVQSNTGKLDLINQSVKKYNTAVEYCKSQSGVDMAVIQLRSLLKQTPKFLKARQLLALCYLQQKQPDHARRELEKCKAIDVNNTMTLRYLAEAESMLNPTEDPKKKDKGSKGAETVSYLTPENELIIQPVGNKEHRGSNTILNIIFGMACGFALCFFIVLPAKLSNEQLASQANIKAISEQLDAKNLRINELEKNSSEQTAKIATLSENLNKYVGTEGTLLSMESLLKAASLYLENPDNYLEIADYISSVDELSWTEETSENYKALYYTLKAAIGPNVSAAYLKEGSGLYKSKEYEDAIAYFEAAVFFDEKSAEALYQLGVTYAAAERLGEAEIAYNRVIEKFPDSSYASKATSALKKLEK